ncbi:hypothetical protein C8Q78DRAFT_1020412 [Trametes maxima]|nr:hypothetical protein C8Q78DRAFT_1020412 [Trametes maxima]
MDDKSDGDTREKSPNADNRYPALDVEAAVSTTEAWSECADILRDRDRDLVNAWADQADGLVTFAALFSGVITAFILETYKNLSPDPSVLTLDVLLQILAHIDDNSALEVASLSLPRHTTPFHPALSDILQNAFLFASLICSLLAAGMGIFYKEWTREYTLDLPKDAHECARVRQYRHEGMKRWNMRTVISAISIFLQLGVAFFIGAIVLFVWTLHPVLRLVLAVFVSMWSAFWFGTAFISVGYGNAPFKAPLSRAIYAVGGLVVRLMRRPWGRPQDESTDANKAPLLPTFEAREMRDVQRRGSDLDMAALSYAFSTRGDSRRLEGLRDYFHGLTEQPPQPQEEFSPFSHYLGASSNSQEEMGSK